MITYEGIQICIKAVILGVTYVSVIIVNYDLYIHTHNIYLWRKQYNRHLWRALCIPYNRHPWEALYIQNNSHLWSSLYFHYNSGLCRTICLSVIIFTYVGTQTSIIRVTQRWPCVCILADTYGRPCDSSERVIYGGSVYSI
jgi:hypothetical protein